MLRDENELQGKITSFMRRKDAQHPGLSEFAEKI
jgi:hypothetical protein